MSDQICEAYDCYGTFKSGEKISFCVEKNCVACICEDCSSMGRTHCENHRFNVVTGTIDQTKLDKTDGVYEIQTGGRYIVTENLVAPLILGGDCGDDAVIDFSGYSIRSKNYDDDENC